MQPSIGVFNLFLDEVQFVSSTVCSKSEHSLTWLCSWIKWRDLYSCFSPDLSWRWFPLVANKKKGRPRSAPTGSWVRSQFLGGFCSGSLSSPRSTGKQRQWVGAGRGGRFRLGWFSWQFKVLLYLGNKWETSVPRASKLLSFTSPALHTWQFFRKETPKPVWLWSLQTEIKSFTAALVLKLTMNSWRVLQQ